MNDNMKKYKPDWLEAKQRMEDWWAGKKTDRVVASVTAPVRAGETPVYINDTPEKYIDAKTVFHNLDRQLNHTFWGGEGFPYHFLYYGPMFQNSVYFGAEPIFADNTTWYDPCFNNLDEIIAYEPDPANNKWWQASLEMTRRSVERSGGGYLVTHSGVLAVIDILAILIGNEQLLCAMADEPEKVVKARDAILKHTAPSYDASYDIIGDLAIDSLGVWAPGKTGTNQCDLCVMISPDMFDRFVYEDLKVFYDYMDYGVYHLDGEEEIKHLDSLLTLKKMHMIQWVPSARVNDPDYADPLNWIGLFRRIQDTGRRVLIYTPYHRVKELLNKIDRSLVFLNVGCPDAETAHQVLKDLEYK